MLLIFSVTAAASGLAIIVTICLQTASPDAGFSAAMGGGDSRAAHRKGGQDELLERILKVSAVVWVVCCLIIAWLEAHPGAVG